MIRLNIGPLSKGDQNSREKVIHNPLSHCPSLGASGNIMVMIHLRTNGRNMTLEISIKV